MHTEHPGPYNPLTVGIHGLRLTDRNSNDFSNCAWDCMDDAYNDSNCPSSSDVGCLCEDPNALKRASSCIDSRCFQSDISQLNLAMENCGAVIPQPNTPTQAPSHTSPPTTKAIVTTASITTSAEHASPSLSTTPSSTPASVPPSDTLSAPLSTLPVQSSSFLSEISITQLPSLSATGSPSSPATLSSTSRTLNPASAQPTDVLPGVPFSGTTAVSPTGTPSTSASYSGSSTLSSQVASSAEPEPSQAPGGLSPNVVIPVSAVIGVVVLAVFIALALCIRRRRRSNAYDPHARRLNGRTAQGDKEDPYTHFEKRKRATVDERSTFFIGNSLSKGSTLTANRHSTLWVSGSPVVVTGILPRAPGTELGSDVSPPPVQAMSDWDAGVAPFEGAPLLHRASLLSGRSDVPIVGLFPSEESAGTGSEGVGSETSTTAATIQSAQMLADPRRRSLESQTFDGPMASSASAESEKTAASERRPSAIVALGQPVPQSPAAPPSAGTLSTSIRSSSSQRQPRFVTVLMEVKEDDTEEDDQLPPYQPRPQDTSPVPRYDRSG
ncbi:hypothetical protein BC628DRAFT_138795 [Trametes gibbosa]|nr:hypothetical protein BC628DRAFT_138795 [Trametes gibbosa]